MHTKCNNFFQRHIMTFMKALLAAALVSFAMAAQAGTLMGAGYYTSGVFTFNTNTGAATLIAGSNDIDNGLGYDSSSGTLYGLRDNQLYTVNTTTGQRTLVTSLSQFITELEYNPLDGKMYGILGGGGLATVNTTTGVVTAIGASDHRDFVVTLAISGSGQSYAASVADNKFYEVDLATGAFSLLFNGAFGPESGMTAMAFDDQDLLYAVGTFSDQLGLIDTTTGMFSTLGSFFNGLDRDVRSMEFIGDKRGTFSAVPEPSSLALIAMALAGLGAVTRRRQA